MVLEKILKKRGVRKAVALSTIGSLLFLNCGKRENPVGPEEPKTITVTVDPSQDNSISLGDYGVVIPANSLQTDSLSDSAIVTVSKSDAIFPATEAEIKTEKIRFFSDRPLADTIFFKFPNSANSPFGYSLVRDSNTQRNYPLEGMMKGDSVIVPYFPVQDSVLRRPVDGITSDITVDFEWDPELNQKVELYGNVNTVLSSNEPALIMVHGIGSSPSTFQQIGPTGKTELEEMSSFYDGRVLLFQYPSGKPVSENADSLSNRLLKLKEKNPNILFDGLCHSMGGAVFRTAVQKHPELFRSIVTMGTPHDGVLYAEEKTIVDFILNNDAAANLLFKLKGFSTPGAKDLYHGSDFLNLLNNYNQPINVSYLTIAGDNGNLLSWIVDGEFPDDGFVAVRSAALGHAFFPNTREKPNRLESRLVNLGHTDFTKGSSELYEITKDFLGNDLDLQASCTGPFLGALILGDIPNDYGDGYGEVSIAQEFKTSRNGLLDKLEAYVITYFSPSSDFYWTLRDATNLDTININIDQLPIFYSGTAKSVAFPNDLNSYLAPPVLLSSALNLSVSSGQKFILQLSSQLSTNNLNAWIGAPDSLPGRTMFLKPDKDSLWNMAGWVDGELGRRVYVK